MKPHSLFWRLGVNYLTLALLVLGGSQTAEPQNASHDLPKIASLKSISYQKTDQPNTASVAPHRNLVNTVRLAEAYSRVTRVPPIYHEPILTRGASGISVFRNASPAVVLIVVGEIKNDQFDPSGLGAGVVINSSGDILTNWHLTDGYTEAVIFFKPQGTDIANSKAYVASVVAQSEISDLALLHLEGAAPSLTPIPIGNISSVQVAEDIHVIGHPKGNPWSYSTGVVSQIRMATLGLTKTAQSIRQRFSNCKPQSVRVIPVVRFLTIREDYLD